MKKQSSAMSLEELWQLYPIILKEHNTQYKHWFEIEKQLLLYTINSEDIVRINHIGSSAVEGLLSKPTVDILLEIDGCCNVTQLTDNLKSIEWKLNFTGKDPINHSIKNKYFKENNHNDKSFSSKRQPET